MIVSLANTGEVLSIVNRPGNRPSHEGAAEQLDLAILLCREAGFRRISLRGDTDFTQTKQLDAWDAEGVTFLFGIDAMPNLKAIAEDRPASDWAELKRLPPYKAKGKPRSRPERVKDRIVRERGYETLTRVREDVAVVAYRPTACQESYRLIIVRQTIMVEKGQMRLLDEIRYRFYRDSSLISTSVRMVCWWRCSEESRPRPVLKTRVLQEFATTGPRTPETAINQLSHCDLRQNGGGDKRGVSFYLTNDREGTGRELVFKANDRCDQENLIAQLKGGAHALRAAVDNLVSNWAYMVMTALGWNLKAWLALSVPEHPRHQAAHREQKRQLLRMEFKRFVNAIILMPCQIARGGHRLIYRLLSWNGWQGVFLRVVHALRC